MRKVVAVAVLATLMIMFSSSILGTNIVVFAESLEYTIWKTIPPTVTPEFVADIAARVFDMLDPIVDEINGLFYVNSSWPQYLEVYEASGSIWYADFSKMYSESYVPELPPEEDGYAKAQDFLLQHDLLPTNAYLVGFGNTTTSILEADINETQTVSNSLDVIFGFNTPYETALDSVGGPGAKIRVSLGDGGEIIGFHRVWRELEVWDVYPAITEDEAIEMLRERFKAEHKAGFNIVETDVRLAYYGEPENVVQTYVQPYYIFDGVVIINGEKLSFCAQKVPATSFSPKVSIDSPVYGDRFLVGDSITFEASEPQGGNGPYTYRWEWNGSILSESKSFNTSLPCGNEMREVELAPHTIMLTVTDSNGVETTDYVSIIVTVICGDINGDGKCNIMDIAGAAKAFGTSPGHPRWNFMADLNNDDTVNIMDIATAAMDFGKVTPKSAASSSLNYDSHILQSHGGKPNLTTLLVPGFIILLLPLAISSMRERQKKKGLAGLLLATVIVANLMTSLPSVRAQPNDDANLREVGLESCGQNLAIFATASSNGFKNVLRLIGGWTVRFHWYEWWAWEEDFKYRNGPAGGTDFYWMDTVDFGYYVGHGNPWCIAFSSSKDFRRFEFTNARWGGTTGGNPEEEADLEWVALESCNTLQNPAPTGQSVFSRWRQAFKGLHYVLGFHTSAQATLTMGRTFALYMVRWLRPLSVRCAWIRATQTVQPSSVRGAYLRAGNSPYLGPNDTYGDSIRPWRVAPDPYPYDFLAYCSWSC